MDRRAGLSELHPNSRYYDYWGGSAAGAEFAGYFPAGIKCCHPVHD